MPQSVRQVADPYTETDVHYLVVGVEGTTPDIIEVEKGTPNSFRMLDAKSHAMKLLRERIDEATKSLARIRAIGVEIPRLM